jgi:hypothetical protein
MTGGDLSADRGSIVIGGNATGPVVNVQAPKALSLALTVEQNVDRQLPSFLARVILTFSEQSLSHYGKGSRRPLPPEVSEKLKHNYFPPDHRFIRDFVRFSHVLENCYRGIEQRNADARYLVRRKAGVVYSEELRIASGLIIVSQKTLLEYVREHATELVANVTARLFEDYRSSSEVKVEQEVADLAITLIVADAIVECEVLERPEDATTA